MPCRRPSCLPPGGRGGGRYGDDERRPRRGEGEEDMGPSRAEMSDNWGSDRKFVPGGPDDRGRGGFGGGFRDRDGDRERGFGGGFRDRSRWGQSAAELRAGQLCVVRLFAGCVRGDEGGA